LARKKRKEVKYDTTTPNTEEIETFARIVSPDFLGAGKKTKTERDGFIAHFSKFSKINDGVLKNNTPNRILDILRYNHPDVSQAIWNFKIIGNSGYDVNVTLLDGETEHKVGKKTVEGFFKKLDFYNSSGFEKSKGIDRIVNIFFDSLLVRGAIAMEMVLDNSLSEVLYFEPVDPSSISFRMENGRPIPYQNSVKLDIPTFFYEGIDEFINDPYGTSPFLSCVQAIAFHLQVMEDIKMVVHNQGYGKYDIKIIEEVLLKRMPIAIRNNDSKKQEWLDTQLTRIIEAYSKLEPDDAFVHFDSVEVDMVDTAKTMLDPQKIMSVIDTQLLGALKQYSTLMGRRSQGQTEQYAKLEIKIFMQSAKYVRKPIEIVLSRALTKLLNIYGMQGYVHFKFRDTEIRTDLEKSQFEQVAIQNAVNKRNQGFISQDQASKEIVGRKAYGEPIKDMLGLDNEDSGGYTDERVPSNPSSSDNNNNDSNT
jgi:hypothetical protein